MWGFRDQTPTLFHFDGSAWREVAAPGPAVAMHGTSLEDVTAVGHRGLIARYDGREFRALPSPVRETLNGVAVVSARETYAIAASGALLEDSGEGFRLAERLEHPLNAIGVHGGSLYASGPWPAGLMKRTASGLESIDRLREGFQIECRRELLVAAPDGVFSSPDGEQWASFPLADFEALVADKPPRWRAG